jgi:hypothetical protein
MWLRITYAGVEVKKREMSSGDIEAILETIFTVPE